ncbi:ATP-binding cassette domain-containing protein [Novosphingobium sp. FSY-8]|uniref:ATP-binding cassette domain-containing protein n=2 Tax=Novosphingobium ovatum TaxID=1908523 RepID=A0ABW9XD45_9SPHN|nr:ATP-binding cassette domain-containing protein [Novosphingobium ovatum]
MGARVPHVRVENLRVLVPSKGGDIAIIDNISFAIGRGEVLALIGESGSGKSTTALAVMGWCRHGSRIGGGQIFVGETEISALSEAELRPIRGRRIAYIAQSAAAAFNPSRTIIDQVVEPALIHGLMSRQQAENKAVSLFRALSLPMAESIGNRYPHQVSGGQLQRLMAAMALITEPELVILDEPTTALDVTTQVEVLKCFKAALAQAGASAIYVSHDLAVVAQMADRIAVLKQGTLREEGPAAQVLENPRDAYTSSLLSAVRPAPVAAKAPCDAAPLLAIRGLVAGYGALRDGVPSVPVLRDISLELQRGGTLGIIGESGSGKSTLARVIAGLLPAAQGQVLLDGTPLPPAVAGRSRAQLRQIQMVFQNADTALNPAHSVAGILGRPLEFYHGLKGDAATCRIAELMELIRLPRDLIHRPVRELSGGQKQRVNLARALAAQPQVLLCDEVTSALDTVVGAAIMRLIDDLRRELGIATVFISHDIHAVSAFCEDVLVLYGGAPVEMASREVFNGASHHPYTRLLLSSLPAMDPAWLGRVQPPVPTCAAAQCADLCRFVQRCPVAVPGLCDRVAPPVHAIPGQRWLCHFAPTSVTERDQA